MHLYMEVFGSVYKFKRKKKKSAFHLVSNPFHKYLFPIWLHVLLFYLGYPGLSVSPEHAHS
ncbi:rCG43232 [Rattus norvegicus]|uniref:RCG43232 n=1 Tax=Rattus norvegicus TaxID=10116 RepID=A6IVN6_RAT|nr:rCG43232 [Rattus norvegicus]